MTGSIVAIRPFRTVRRCAENLAVALRDRPRRAVHHCWAHEGEKFPALRDDPLHDLLGAGRREHLRPADRPPGVDAEDTSGSRTFISASKSPARAAARKASMTRRCSATSASVGGVEPRTRRRSPGWRAAVRRRARGPVISADLGERNSEHVVQDERDPLGGERFSSTTSIASPTESASSASGWVLLGRSRLTIGLEVVVGLLATRLPAPRSMSSATRPTTVVSQARRFSHLIGIGAAQGAATPPGRRRLSGR